MNPKIMVINNRFNILGGAEKLISELSNYLAYHNYPVVIFTPFACPEFKQTLKDIRIIETENEQNLFNYVSALAHKFDIINPHNHPTELYLPYPIKLPKVWQCNEPPETVLRGGSIEAGEREYVRRTTKKVVVLTNYDKFRFEKTYGIEPAVNLPGIDYGYFSESVKPRNTLNMRDNFVITQVGYFTWTKNQVRTVEIFSEVIKEIPKAKLVLAGYDANAKTDYSMNVHKKVEELGLEDDVLFIDFLNEEDLRNLYKQTNVFISPILDQGGILSVFEAIAAGVPTIVSPYFVASDIIKERNLGRISDVDENFIKAILDIYSSLGEEKQKTAENAKWIGENLTWKHFGKKYEEIFEEALR